MCKRVSSRQELQSEYMHISYRIFNIRKLSECLKELSFMFGFIVVLSSTNLQITKTKQQQKTKGIFVEGIYVYW